MPVYGLDKDIIFPHPELADDNGLLAIGGDLQPKRLILAYANGIFPWYSENDPIMWFSPNPRMVLFLQDFRLKKSLAQTVRSGKFIIKFDHDFVKVIDSCKKVKRKGEEGTWITDDMRNAFIKLHEMGIAHSVASYYQDKLVGGLYGISLGKAFFGESMFHIERDASKVALFYLVEKLKSWNFNFIDAQVETQHLKSLGAINISRKEFLSLLDQSIQYKSKIGRWK